MAAAPRALLTPNARLRKRVVALAKEHTAALEEPAAIDGSGSSAEVAGTESLAMVGGVGAAGPDVPDAPPVQLAPIDPVRRAARSRWARLIARIYEISPLGCPNCGAEMRILAFLTDPPVIVAILRHLDLPTRPPTLTPAREPPQPDLPLDAQAPASRLWPSTCRRPTSARCAKTCPRLRWSSITSTWSS